MSRSELKSKAKKQLGNKITSENWFMAVLVLIIATILTGTALSGLFNLPAVLKHDMTSNVTVTFSSTSSFFTLLSLVVGGPIEYGYIKMFLKQSRDGEKMVIGDLFNGFKEDFLDLFIINLVRAIKIILWSLLFIIPGIIKGLSYSMVYYIKADNPNYEWKDCFAESERIMKGNKGKLFILELSFIGWNIIGALCFGIGTFWVSAYTNATKAHFYQSISNKLYSEMEEEF